MNRFRWARPVGLGSIRATVFMTSVLQEEVGSASIPDERPGGHVVLVPACRAGTSECVGVPRFLSGDAFDYGEALFPTMPSSVPLVEQQLHQVDQGLSFARVNRHDDIDVFFHVGANVPDAPNVVDRID